VVSKKKWKRSKNTTGLVGKIRAAIISAGYEEELGIVPMFSEFSVLAVKDGKNYNVRLDKKSLKITSAEMIEYRMKQNRIRRVFRNKIT
jgi:hypothetical protein